MNRIFIKNQEDCCGCGACVQKCPKHAITLSQDNEGFEYPIIDNNICIDCGLCLKVCHWSKHNFNPTDNYTKSVYCAYNQNDQITKDSSSGGIFWLIVQYVIEKGGSVFGAVADGFIVYHRRGDTLENCKDFRKSKYLQSDTKETYIEAKNDLQQNRLVLYSGTPCQVAGLYSFLGKSYDNLITCEVVCHGVPSRYAFDKWLCDLTKENYGKKPISMIWRDKTNGWGPNYVTYNYEDGSTWSVPSQQNLFQKGFLENLYLRPSCYECHYARIPRIADITLADFWGYDGDLVKSNNNKGLSIIITSSANGEQIIDSVKKHMFFESVNISYVKERSRHVWTHPQINNKRQLFFLYLRNNSFSKSAKRFLYPTTKERILLKIRHIKKLIGL